MNDTNCPYCDAEIDIDHDDGYGFQEDEVYQQECQDCNQVFTYQTSVIYHYSTEKASCLNGGEHDYKPTITHPSIFTEMRCSMCDDTRPLTEGERIELKIPTKEEYLTEFNK